MTDRRPEPTMGGAPDELVHERASATPSRAIDAKRAATVGHKAAEAPREMSLRDAQAWFAKAITHPGSASDGVRDAASVVGNEASLEQLVTAGPELDAIDRLGIYHYAYRARLIDCLADDYAAVKYAIGAEAFDALCSDYITAHPSTNPNLVGFGKHFASFCRARTEAWSAFAAELSALEWAMTEVVHAADAPALDATALQSIPPEQWAAARFTPAATLRMLRFAYPTNVYFQAYRRKLARDGGGHGEEGDVMPIPDAAPSATAVYRQGFTIWRMDLTPAMAGLLDALCDGATLGDALEAVESHVESPEALAEAERNVMAWFGTWVSSGFFSKLEFEAASK